MFRLLARQAVVLGAILVALALTSSASVAGTRGADELFWVPTYEQALEMAETTGRPIFMMFYTCVGTKSPTYSGETTVW